MADRYVGGLRVAAPEPTLHLAKITREVAKTFWGDTAESTLATINDAFKPGGSYSWADSRIGMTDNGSIATHVGVVDFKMRVGGQTRLRTAGLAGIFTVEEHRRRGWMRQTMSDVLTALQPAGFDISLLYGIDGFYEPFGFRRAWSDYSFRVKAIDLPSEIGFELEEFTDEHPEEVIELAHRAYTSQTGSVVREGGWFTSLNEDRGHLWRGADGAIAGYVFTRLPDEQLLITDHAGEPNQVLAVVGHLMQRLERDRVTITYIPPACALARSLRQGNAREVVHHRRNGDALVRIVNLRSTLQKLIPEMKGALSRSLIPGWEGALRVDGDMESVTLHIEGGQLQIAEARADSPHVLAGPALSQLLIGTDDSEEFIEEGTLVASGEGRELASALFPARNPAMPAPDHF